MAVEKDGEPCSIDGVDDDVESKCGVFGPLKLVTGFFADGWVVLEDNFYKCAEEM